MNYCQLFPTGNTSIIYPVQILLMMKNKLLLESLFLFYLGRTETKLFCTCHSSLFLFNCQGARALDRKRERKHAPILFPPSLQGLGHICTHAQCIFWASKGWDLNCAQAHQIQLSTVLNYYTIGLASCFLKLIKDLPFLRKYWA